MSIRGKKKCHKKSLYMQISEISIMKMNGILLMERGNVRIGKSNLRTPQDIFNSQYITTEFEI